MREGIKNSQYKHGMSGNNRFYRVWRNILSRCKNKNATGFHNYGGRGISVCKKWESFINFYNDMYKDFLIHIENFGIKETFIDRKNNNGNYCKRNCRWVTRSENCLNVRYNGGAEAQKVYITFRGIKDSKKGWAKRLNMNVNTLSVRLRRFGVEKALTYPLFKQRGKIPKELPKI